MSLRSILNDIDFIYHEKQSGIKSRVENSEDDG